MMEYSPSVDKTKEPRQVFPPTIDKKTWFRTSSEQRLWHDLLCKQANVFELLPKRPAEVEAVYAYRLLSFEPTFPLLDALEQLSVSVANQELSSHNERVTNSLKSFYTAELVPQVVDALAKYGCIYALPTLGADAGGSIQPMPLLVKPYQVVAESDDLSLLVFTECYLDIMNPDTFEVSDKAVLWVYKAVDSGAGLLAKYETNIRKSKPSVYTKSNNAEYLGKWRFSLQDDLQLVEGFPIRLVAAPIKVEHWQHCPQRAVSYLRMKTSWLDTLNTTGYVQRFISPSAEASDLDMPIDIEDYQTGNQFLIKAQNFGFAEMSGSVVSALLVSLQTLATEQLKSVGLDLNHSASQSGKAIQLDYGRFKEVADHLGTNARNLVGKLLLAYYPELANSLEDLALTGLDDYQITDTETLVSTAKSMFELLRLADVNTEMLQVELLKKLADKTLAKLKPEELQAVLDSLKPKADKPVSSQTPTTAAAAELPTPDSEAKPT